MLSYLSVASCLALCCHSQRCFQTCSLLPSCSLPKNTIDLAADHVCIKYNPTQKVPLPLQPHGWSRWDLQHTHPHEKITPLLHRVLICLKWSKAVRRARARAVVLQPVVIFLGKWGIITHISFKPAECMNASCYQEGLFPSLVVILLVKILCKVIPDSSSTLGTRNVSQDQYILGGSKRCERSILLHLVAAVELY